MDLIFPLAISLGAIMGALSRYYITLFWIEKRGQSFPYGTMLVNLTGAFLIGLASMIATKHNFPIAIEKLVLVGFFGAYTTFSSYILDSTLLFRSQRTVTGFFYWLGIPLMGFIALELGMALARKIG